MVDESPAETDVVGGDPGDGSERPDYTFARRPRWVLSHLLVLALIVGMIAAGLWQIDRHNQRASRNALIETRSAEAPVPLSSVVVPGSDPSVGTTEQFRRVVVVGEYRPQDEVLVRNRTYDGAPGWWVLTPLVTDDGWAVAVNRGWIPLTFEDDAPRPGTEPPAGRVEVTGTIQPTRTAEGFQIADPDEGVLTSLGRPDVGRLAAQLDYDLAPVVVRLDPGPAASGAPESLPIPLDLPPLDAGPHASYAAQWFIFTAIALIGYPLVLRRVARGRADSVPE